MIFRKQEIDRYIERVCGRMWNAGKENIFATVCQDERGEPEEVGFQSYVLVMSLFSYMMLAVAMATTSPLGQ